MAEDRIITLRFQEWKVMDMELYRNLEKGKSELGMSMPAYVKDILRRHMEGGRKEPAGMGIYMEEIREIVHGELASQSDALAGVLEGIAERVVSGAKERGAEESLPERETGLPEYSDSFPDGLSGVLEKFI